MSVEHSGKQAALVGPWGGEGGYHWDDGVHSTVRQVEIAHGAGVDSIRIEYDVNGRSVWSQVHGGIGGTKIDKIRLEYPNEYLTSVHGYYGSLQEWGPVFVRSLSFQTNTKTYGPFGVEDGTYFTFPNTHGKIIGFLGKSGRYLDSIGGYVEPLHAPLSSNPVYHPHNYGTPKIQETISHETRKYEYSTVQGSIGTNYDLIVAFKRKDGHDTSPITFSPQMFSHDSTHPPKILSHDSTHPPKILSHESIHPPKILSHESTHPPKIISHDSTQTPKIQEIVSDDKPRNMENKIEKVGSKNFQGVVTSGPWGGNGGILFDDGVYDGIRQVNVTRNVCIVSIRACYDQNGQPVWGTKNGGTGSFRCDKIPFDYPSERLTHLTGYYGPAMMMGPNAIKSVTFHTTKGKYGPYGEEHGEFFTTKLKEGAMIVGFHGRKGMFLDAIGVHVLEGKLKPAAFSHGVSSPNNQTALVPKKADNSEWPLKVGRRGQGDEVVYRLVKDPAPYGPGPWGGEGGKPWDDGVFTGIKQIILTITDAVCCMEIEYDRNGQSIWSVKHGAANGGQTANRVKLDYPNEVLTCISGYYGPTKREQGTQVIHSLTFHTSRKKYGPFGAELGTYFVSGTTEGKVVGFHGRSSMYLDAIGVHMQHWLGNKKPSKPLMKMFS